MAQNDDTRLNLSAGVASVGVAFVLVALKLWALSQTNALSVAASLADSAMDLMISLGGLVAIYYAARPADDDHTFGHSSAEDLAALGQSLFILMSAGAIGWTAFMRLLSGTPSTLMDQGAGIIVMVISIVLTVALVLWQRRVAKRTGNRVVAADSLHYIGDLLPSIGAIIALWVSSQFGIGQIDNIVAIAAAVFMAVGATRLFTGAWNALMDRAADPDLIAGIEDIVRDWPGVRGYHDLQTRTAGSRVFVNIHIELDGDQTLYVAHGIGAGLKRAIVEAYPQVDLIVHKDPARNAQAARGGA